VGQLVDQDQEHLRLLKLGFYIMAGVIGFCSLFSVFYIAMGSIFASSVTPSASTNVSPWLIGTIFLGFGLAFFLLGLAAAVLTYFAGRSLSERRHRIFCMIVAALLCLSIPFGTVLGICAIIVLNRPSVADLFDRPGVTPIQL
jgi:hypothetical protein